MKKIIFSFIGGFLVFFGALIFVDWRIAFLPALDGLALALIPPMLYILIVEGPRGFASAFAALGPSVCEKAPLEKARSVFKNWGIASSVWGGVAALAGVLTMVRDLTDKKRLGFFIYLSLVSLLYALFISLSVCLTGRMLAEKKLKILSEGGDEEPQDCTQE